MRRGFILFLSVIIVSVAGCGKTELNVEDAAGTENLSPEAAEEMVAETEESFETEDSAEEVERTESISSKAQKQSETAESRENIQTEQSVSEQTADAQKTEPSAEESVAEQTEQSQPEQPFPEELIAEQQPQEQQEEPRTELKEYNPDEVCSIVISKCQAGGMITSVDNLANALAEGRITQEEYDSYYPYDGLGYYSVFIETDLNAASTTSGRKLESVEGIVDYLAGMLLLETEQVFYIENAGVCNLNGTEFYEFRCYR